MGEGEELVRVQAGSGGDGRSSGAGDKTGMRWWKTTLCGSNEYVGGGVFGSRSSRSAAGRSFVGSGSGSWGNSWNGERVEDRSE